MDELNQNECMGSLTGVINHLVKNKISPQPKQVNVDYNFVKTPHKFTVAKLSIRKLGSSPVLISEDPSLRIVSFAIINLLGVSIKLYLGLYCKHTRNLDLSFVC